MKFSSSLKFNAVSEWWDEYIAYDTLKKYIYQLEKKQHDLEHSYHDIEAPESRSLMGNINSTSTDSLFIPILDRELRKISNFYEAQEKVLMDEVQELEALVQDQEDRGLETHPYFDDDGEEDDEEDDEDINSVSRSPNPARRRRAQSTPADRALRTASGNYRAPRDHRYSISSDEGNRNLELSTGSLKWLSSTSGRSSIRSPIRNLANRFNILRDSYVSGSQYQNADIWTSSSNYAYDTRLLFKRRITTIYVTVTSLKSYVEVNYSGFRKILKKYDKVTYSELKDRYLHEVVESAQPFTQPSKSRINGLIARLLALYTKCVTQGDTVLAQQQLKLHQREKIAWERDTVWRQMIGKERRGELGGELSIMGAVLETEPEPGLIDVPTPVGRFKLTKKKISLTFAIVLFVILLNVQVADGIEANRCFAILMFSTVLWATEAIPLFVTSLLVPLLLVCLRVIRSEALSGETPTRLTTPQATKYIFSVMFSPTIMLLIGGFTISSALSKTNIDRVLITRVLSLAGTRPSTVLLAFMGVSCFASMWISNVAAPTLCFTLIRPILRTLPAKSSFGPCLILAIALAANIGGQSSPISSPQNLIALQAMDPPLDWASWFAVSLPVSALSIVLIWLLLLVSYRPGRSPDGEDDIEIKTIRPTKEAFTLKQYWVTLVCLVTIGFWCVEHEIEEWVGDMGIIAIFPIVAFFATGVLKKDDFEQFAWTIVFLAMGGIALGKGVLSSGLLEVMGVLIRSLVTDLSLYTVVIVLSPVVLIISTFISHTIASVLLVPIAKEVGMNLPGNHANLLIFITGLICSAGMGMPVSGFPNQTAATQEDDLGQLYLTNVDFLKNGVPASVFATLVVISVGFVLMKAIGL